MSGPSTLSHLKNNADEAEASLADRFARQVIQHDPSKHVQVFTGTLTCEHAVRIMAAENAAYIGQVQYPYEGLTVAQRDTLLAGGIDDDIARYFVVVRNVDANEEYMLPHPLSSLKQWHLHFLDKPIFRHVNIAREPDFDSLTPPGKDSAGLWTSTKLRKGGHLFLVIVSLAPLAALPEPGLNLDTVILYLRSPRLAMDHTTFRSTALSSEQRRAVAIHHALLAIAQHVGFDSSSVPPSSGSKGRSYGTDGSGGGGGGVATALPKSEEEDEQEDTTNDPQKREALARGTLLHGDRITVADACASISMCGAFVSNTPEANAGSVIVPLALKYARFLLPALSSGQPLLYDIVQPHRYGYAFQVRSVGGWQLLGAVNMFGSMETIQTQFQARGLIPDDRLLSTNRGSQIRPVSGAVPSSTPNAISAALQNAALAQRGNRQNFEADYFLWAKTVEKTVYRPFRLLSAKARIADIDRPTTDAQKRMLPSGMWRALMAHAGLSLLLDQLTANLHSTTSGLQVQRGNRFVDLWLSTMATAHPTPLLRLPSSSTLEIASVLFEICNGIATAVFGEIRPTLMPSNRTVTAKDLIVYVIYPAHRGMPPLVFPLPQVTAIFRSCRGIPPNQWHTHGIPSLYADATQLAMVLLHHPSVYANLVPPTMLSALTSLASSSAAVSVPVPVPTFQPLLLQQTLCAARHHDQDIMRAYKALLACTSSSSSSKKMPVTGPGPAPTTTPPNDSPEMERLLMQAFAYVLFTTDADGLAAKWA